MAAGSVEIRVTPAASEGRRALRRVWLMVATAAAVFICADAEIFRFSPYPSLLQPDSSAGSFESVLRAEQQRPLHSDREVMVVGDSRLAEGFSAAEANRLAGETGWHFSSGAVAGTTLRTWYYFLRDLDPGRRRYQAIVLPFDDYSDLDRGDPAERIADLHQAIARLKPPDILDFAFSFHKPENRMRALLGTLFKGLVYKQDFQQFVRRPKLRFQQVSIDRNSGTKWRDKYAGNPASLDGVEIDPARRRITRPGGLTENQAVTLRNRFLPARYRQLGYTAEYRRKWLGRIVDLYRGTGTRIVLLRMPYGPFPRPAVVLPVRSVGVIAEFTRQGRAVAIPEAHFAPLEKPELFADGVHLNRRGRLLFTAMLAREFGREIR